MPFDSTVTYTNETLDDLRILEKARHRIRLPQLWCRGHMIKGNRLCMMGAIAYACGVSKKELQRINSGATMEKQHEMHYDHIIAVLERYIPEFVLPDYNDDFEVTHADVIKLFDRAIADHQQRLSVIT